MRIFKLTLSLLLAAGFWLLATVPAKAIYCDPPHTGDWTINTACVLYEDVNGAALGDITVQPGTTLTLHAGKTLVWYPGRQINIPNGARIIVNNTAKIDQNYLCLKESGTNSNYPAGRTAVDPRTGNPLYLGLDAINASTSGQLGGNAPDLTTGQVGWWRLDQPTGYTTDSSPTGATLTPVNSPSYGAGKIGNAVSLNGSNQRLWANNAAFNNITDNFTIAAWVNRTAGGKVQIISKTGASGSGGFALLAGNAGEVYCRTDNGSTYMDSFTTYGGWVTSSSGWTHVAAVKNGPTCNIYVNGIERAATLTSHTMTGNSVNLTVGARADATTEFFAGQIDDARVYNRALTPTEIAELAGGSNPIAKYCPTGYKRREAMLSINNQDWYVDLGTTGATGALASAYRYLLNLGFTVSSINSGAKETGTPSNPVAIKGDNLQVCPGSACTLTTPTDYGNVIVEGKVGINYGEHSITSQGSYTFPGGTTTLGTDSTHDNKDITIPNGATVYIWGIHRFASVTVQSGGILDVGQYGESNDSNRGSVHITANTISVTGTGKINAYGRGYGGGGGGGGGRYGDTNYCTGTGGAGGTPGNSDANGIVGQSNGGLGGAGCRSAGGSGGGYLGGAGETGYPGAPGGKGGKGSGPFGGNGGDGTAAAGNPPAKGGNGAKGGYLSSQTNGDTTTDLYIVMGSGGGGGGGSSSNNGFCGGGGPGGDGGVSGGANPSSCSGGAGGGGGGAGGGAVTLHAHTSITVSGQIIADGAGNASLNAGYGAGGGIVLNSPTINLTGATIRSLGGNQTGSGSTSNGGTIKIFANSYTGNTPNTTNFPSGRVYYPGASNYLPVEDSLRIVTASGETAGRISNSAANTRLRLTNTGTSGRTFDISVTNNSSAFGGGKFVISDRGTDLSIDTARLAITSAGNVGIGTANPSAKLSILNTAGNGDIEIDNDANGPFIRSYDRGTSSYKAFNLYAGSGTGSNYGRFYFMGSSASTTYMALINGSGSTQGYVYGDSSGFGLLNNTGNWIHYTPSGTQYALFTREIYPGNPNGAAQSSYYLAGNYSGYGLYTNTKLYASGSLYGGEVYATNWFRPTGGGGIYWNSIGTRIWSADTAYIKTGSDLGIDMYDQPLSRRIGLIYGDSSGFGLLNNQGYWAIWTPPNTQQLFSYGQIGAYGATGFVNYNPNNTAASVQLAWYTAGPVYPRIRIGGTGAGSAGPFQVRGPGESYWFEADSSGNIVIPGASGYGVYTKHNCCGADDWLRLVRNNDRNTYHDLAVGLFYANGAQRYDLAEVTPVNPEEDLILGNLIAVDDGDILRVTKTEGKYDDQLVGIVSHGRTASMTIGGDTGPEKVNTTKDRRPIALAGRVVTIVNLEGGAIKAGDPITSSSTPGTGMKATEAGTIVGRAMEGFDGRSTNSKEVAKMVEKLREELKKEDPKSYQYTDIQDVLEQLTRPLPQGTGRIISFITTGKRSAPYLKERIDSLKKQIDELKSKINSQ